MTPIIIITLILLLLAGITWLEYPRIKKELQKPEIRYAEEIKRGDVVILKATKKKDWRYFGKILSYAFALGLFLCGYYLFEKYLENLALNCKPFLSINSLLVRDLIAVSFLPLVLIYVELSNHNTYKSINDLEYYPPLTTKATYDDIVCEKVTEKLIKQKKQNVSFIFLAMFIFSIGFITRIDAPITNANTVYNQKCIAKAAPFDNLHK